MLFNSYAFILLFLPVALAGHALTARHGTRAACLWLGLMSLGFYAGNGLAHTVLLLGSIAVNYRLGRALALGGPRWLLGAAVAANLLLLGWFKYAVFAAETLGLDTGITGAAVRAMLPIGISFYTFTQIAWLVDAAGGRAGKAGGAEYLLFVTWFPHLVAGPLLHHGETVPQFQRPATFRPTAEGIAIGASVFAIGLFKKVVLADEIAPAADALFATGAAQSAGFLAAWGGALAYTFQLYFDFSGYSDMAVGLSRMFGVRLPANFDSPYRATSIIEFWRRWHMSLSAFLRAYVYIPLGGNRRGRARQYVNLMATMVLAGLWHGAGWNFVAWGAWHGVLLGLNHAWNARASAAPGRIGRSIGWGATMLAVIAGWVLFRAPDFPSALAIYTAMVGAHGVGFLPPPRALVLIPLMAGIVLLLPNMRQWMEGEALVLPGPHGPAPVALRWRPNLLWAGVCFALFALALQRMTRVSPFLYAQF
ncbi:MAG: MBOAT family protein [Alphaproteobacteria bacterium]|nr:MBOAT family protein [Alphaproteobacteria bacterium]